MCRYVVCRQCAWYANVWLPSPSQIVQQALRLAHTVHTQAPADTILENLESKLILSKSSTFLLRIQYTHFTVTKKRYVTYNNNKSVWLPRMYSSLPLSTQHPGGSVSSVIVLCVCSRRQHQQYQTDDDNRPWPGAAQPGECFSDHPLKLKCPHRRFLGSNLW